MLIIDHGTTQLHILFILKTQPRKNEDDEKRQKPSRKNEYDVSAHFNGYAVVGALTSEPARCPVLPVTVTRSCHLSTVTCSLLGYLRSYFNPRFISQEFGRREPGYRLTRSWCSRVNFAFNFLLVCSECLVSLCLGELFCECDI